MSSKTRIVDVIPSTVSFSRAYTNITTGGKTYTCPGCKVYFAPDSTSLPSSLSPATPFDDSIISNNFQLGTQISAGVWTSPFGGSTRYIAYDIDNSNYSPAIYATNRSNSV